LELKNEDSFYTTNRKIAIKIVKKLLNSDKKGQILYRICPAIK